MSAAEQRAGTVIVGGGVIGLASAYYLAQEGAEVTVIDRGEFGGACSHGNCGYICPSHVLPLTEPGAIRAALKSVLNPSSPLYVRPRFSPALWKWMLRFARRCTHRQMLASATHLDALLRSSMCEYRRLVAQESLECEWTPRGLLYVLRSTEAMEDFAQTDRMLHEHFNVVARRIEGEALSTFDPSIKAGMAGAFLYEGDAHVRPDRLIAGWKKLLQAQKVQLISDCELRGMDTARGRVAKLHTNQGDLSLDQLIVATGAWSPRLSGWLKCKIPIQPGKGYSLTTTRPDPCPRQAILFPEHRVGVTPFEAAYRLGSMMEFVGYDETIPERRIQQLRKAAAQYLVAPGTDQEVSRWYGWRPMTWDSLPIIGAVPGLANAYLATGHNMLGMSLATGTGKLIAELVAGRRPHLDAQAFSPARFN